MPTAHRARRYSDSQIEEFRDVLLTLLPEDIAGWQVAAPARHRDAACVKEELLLLVSEERERKNMK